jgi:hypothetical protein
LLDFPLFESINGRKGVKMNDVEISAEVKEETLRLQNATSKRGGRRYTPYVFTEQGVVILSLDST